MLVLIFGFLCLSFARLNLASGPASGEMLYLVFSFDPWNCLALTIPLENEFWSDFELKRISFSVGFEGLSPPDDDVLSFES